MAVNKIRGLLNLKGFNVRTYSLTFNVDYQQFLRKVNCPSKFQVSDLKEISKNLYLSPEEVIEFFLPFVIQNQKKIEENVQ